MDVGQPPTIFHLSPVTSQCQLEHNNSPVLRSWNFKQTFSQMLLLMSGRSQIAGPQRTKINPCICHVQPKMCNFQLVTGRKQGRKNS